MIIEVRNLYACLTTPSPTLPILVEREKSLVLSLLVSSTPLRCNCYVLCSIKCSTKLIYRCIHANVKSINILTKLLYISVKFILAPHGTGTFASNIFYFWWYRCWPIIWKKFVHCLKQQLNRTRKKASKKNISQHENEKCTPKEKCCTTKVDHSLPQPLIWSDPKFRRKILNVSIVFAYWIFKFR